MRQANQGAHNLQPRWLFVIFYGGGGGGGGGTQMNSLGNSVQKVFFFS